MKLAWLADPHLNFLPKFTLSKLIKNLNKSSFDAVAISGDIAEFNNIEFYLLYLDKFINKPIYFVLGNHDLYHGSFCQLDSHMKNILCQTKNFIWLNDIMFLSLSGDTAICGIDGWYDGGFGNKVSMFDMADFHLIDEFKNMSKDDIFEFINMRGKIFAWQTRKKLEEALEKHNRAVLITHVPPFSEVCKCEGKTSSVDSIPFYCCRALGETLLDVKEQFPTKEIIVLCGHTHSKAKVNIDNLYVEVADAQYGFPKIHKIFSL